LGKGGNCGEKEKGDGWGAGDVMMMMARVKEQEREMRENSFAWDAKGSECVEEEWSGSEVTENRRGAYQVVHVLVPNKAVSFLIGKAGINVIAIEKKSGAKVEFTREASPPAAERLVNIKGNAKAVKIAEALLEAKTLEWQTSPTLIR
jgi:predicted PilT family ATPase